MFIAERRTDLVPEDKKDPKLPKGIFSYSQYSLYQRCPKAYEFSYVKGIKIAPNGALYKGQIVHKGVEFGHRVKLANEQPNLEQIQGVVSDEFEKGSSEVLWDEDDNKGKAKDVTIRCYTTYHHVALPKTNPVAVEHPFVIYIGSSPLIGYIDLIDSKRELPADPGLPIVADLKVTGSSWSQADMDKDPQFTLYSKVTGIPTVRVDNLVTLKKGIEFKQQTSKRDNRMYLTVIEHIDETMDLVKKGIFPKTAIDSWSCSEKWCGYWSMCRGKKE